MPLPVSGAISLSQIQTEFGGVNPISLSEYYRGGGLTTPNNTGVPTSGTLSLSNFYGAVRQFTFPISSNQTNANLRTLAINAGWDQSAPVIATIDSGVTVSSNSTGTPALTVNGSFPNGVQLVNNGSVLGMGGLGGNGMTAVCTQMTTGSAGGVALSTSVAVSVTNNGTIAGGGGGGGGGGGCQYTVIEAGYQLTILYAGGGGGGGRTGSFNSGGGQGGDPGLNNGAAGTISGPGVGGPGRRGYPGYGTGGPGGNGGAYGAAGGGGGSSNAASGAAGGGGGAAVSGNSNITWLAFGTRLGSIT